MLLVPTTAHGSPCARRVASPSQFGGRRRAGGLAGAACRCAQQHERSGIAGLYAGLRGWGGVASKFCVSGILFTQTTEGGGPQPLT